MQTSFRIGTRGSPLALAQAGETQRRLMAAHRPAGGRPFAGRASISHQRRPHPGPAAVGGRRQGPVHQGDRGGAARRPHRPRRAFVEGHADACCPTGWNSPPSCRARTRATPLSRKAARRSPTCRSGAEVGSSSLRRQALIRAHAAGPRRRAVSRQRADAAAQAGRRRGRRHLLAYAGLKRLGLEHVATDLMPLDEFPPAPGQGAIGIETRIGDRDVEAMLARRSMIVPTAAGAGLRARLSGRARWLLPHADRRPCHDRGNGSSPFAGLIIRRTARRPHDRVARDRRPQPPRSAGEAGLTLLAEAGPRLLRRAGAEPDAGSRR